jgi:hypothetical protein
MNKQIVIGFNFSPYKLMLGACDMNGKILHQVRIVISRETIYSNRESVFR